MSRRIAGNPRRLGALEVADSVVHRGKGIRVRPFPRLAYIRGTDLTFLTSHSAAIAFAQSLPKSNLRGPYLARLVLAALGGPTNHSEIVHLVVEYYQVFGDKDCWFDDVRSILGLIRQAQSPRLDRELLHGLESAKDGMLNGKTEIVS